MRVVDVNVLLNAVNPSARHHEVSRRWLDRALGGADRVGFASIVQVAFLRLATMQSVFPKPYPADDAVDQLDEWLSAPGAAIVTQGPAHLRLMRSLLDEAGVAGNLVNGAHLAALALEQRGEVVSYDRDFARFARVRVRRPDDLARPNDV